MFLLMFRISRCVKINLKPKTFVLVSEHEAQKRGGSGPGLASVRLDTLRSAENEI